MAKNEVYNIIFKHDIVLNTTWTTENNFAKLNYPEHALFAKNVVFIK